MSNLMGVNSVFVLLLLSHPIIKAQEYVILDDLEPISWDTEEDNPIAEAEKTLSVLCENYHPAINNQKLDCSNLELNSRNDLLGESYHVLHKREVGDNESDDGSGVGEQPHPEISNSNSTTPTSAATHTSSVNSSDNGKAINSDNEISYNQTSSTAPADTPKKDPEAKLAAEHTDSDKTEVKNEQLAEAAVQKSEDKTSEISSSNNLGHINEGETSFQNTTLEEHKANETLAESNVEKNVAADNNGSNTKDEAKEAQLPLNNQTATSTSEPLAAVEQKVDEAPGVINNLTVSLREPEGGNMENKETPQDPKINSKDSNAIEKVFEAAANETEKVQKVNNEEVSSTTHNIPQNQTTIAPPEHTSEANAANGTEKMDKGRTASTHDIPRHETTIAPPVQSSEAISGTWQDVQVKVTSTGAVTVGKKESETSTKKVLPSDLAEVDATTKSKAVEAINDQQSGNAVMFKEPKFGAKASIEASDSEKHLASLATNAKASNASSDSDEPNTGESAKAVSKAGKDTTILVVLFVVVIVVGAAAFTHNFIKKRKQNAAQNNDLVNGIRRSLQNLTSGNEKNSTDVEQGTEMKPLMKTNSPVIVKEYSDTKKEAEA